MIGAIAANTFRETVRDRVLYAILIFAALATLAGVVFGSLSADQDVRVLEDLGLFTITTFGGVIAIFLGTNLVFKEIDRRTIFLIVTKPINRWEFVTGKFFGLALCVFVTNFAMGLFFQLVIWFQTGNFNSALPMLGSLSLIYLELLLVIAIATFFSTFATPLMSMIFTCGLWLVGHLSFSFELLAALARKNDSIATEKLALFLQYVMPDLAKLTTVRGDMMDARYPSADLLGYVIAYILAYLVILLSLSTIIAERREFN
ncbi:MAG: ABC transporter permease [Candidatus Obscuribacterales bacterium]|nr:ABC transporter permease [Candidatus Obscuribacterales bacterium]